MIRHNPDDGAIAKTIDALGSNLLGVVIGFDTDDDADWFVGLEGGADVIDHFYHKSQQEAFAAFWNVKQYFEELRRRRSFRHALEALKVSAAAEVRMSEISFTLTIRKEPIVVVSVDCPPDRPMRDPQSLDKLLTALRQFAESER